MLIEMLASPTWQGIAGLVAIVTLIVTVYFARRGRPSNRESEPKQEKQLERPIQNPIQSEDRSIPVYNAESLEELRRETDVRKLTPLESSRDLSRLPYGVYGYTVPWLINTDSTGVVGGTGVEQMSLLPRSGGTAVMEVHRRSEDGQIFIVGFVSEQQRIDLQDPSRTSTAEVQLFFEPYKEYDELVAIPERRIVYSNNRDIEVEYEGSYENYYLNDVTVS